MAGSAPSLNGATTTAALRANTAAMRTALTSAGFVRTTDTGQLDPTTITQVNTTASTVHGYEVWRFNDALQPTHPIFFKIEYANSTSTLAATFGLALTVGMGSDGAGTITNGGLAYGSTLSTRIMVSGSYNQNRLDQHPAVPAFVGGSDGSGLCCCFFASTATNASFFFWIERARNVSGTPNSDGMIWGYAFNDNNVRTVGSQQFVFSAGYTQTAAATGSLPSVRQPYTANFTTSMIGTTIYPHPIFTGLTPRIGGPSQVLVAMGKGDVNPQTQFAMPHYGTSRTWIAAGAAAGTSAASGGTGYGTVAGFLESIAVRID